MVRIVVTARGARVAQHNEEGVDVYEELMDKSRWGTEEFFLVANTRKFNATHCLCAEYTQWLECYHRLGADIKVGMGIPKLN
jgi:hypothetical protein